MFYANNCLFKTVDGGSSWKQISGDLSRKTYELPKSIGKYADPTLVAQRGVIYTIGPSPLNVNKIWIGTDDGLIQTTADGGVTWKDVTPSQIGPFWKVFMVDAGHFDPGTAYAAVNTLRIDDQRPHFYRTHDNGRTWAEITNGMNAFGAANSIREDPVRKGLLFASTETGVYFSIDDGDNWTSMRLNLPASSARDIIVKDADVAVGTHGRGFWILDDITPLRQIDVAALRSDAVLFRPTTAWRVRPNMSTDMPWPKEEPVGENPADGTPINYYLREAANGPVTLEVFTTDGKLVRRYRSTDPVTPIPDPAAAPVPTYWYRAPHPLSTAAGLHRFMWDLHYQPIGAGGGGGRGGLPINSVPHNGAPAPGTPWVSPGTYNVTLTVNGKSYTQPIVVKQDPRVRTAALAMQEVYAGTNAMYFGAVDATRAVADVASIRSQVAALLPSANAATAAALKTFDAHAAHLQGPAAPLPEGTPLCNGGVAAAPATTGGGGGGRGAGGGGGGGAGGGGGGGRGAGGGGGAVALGTLACAASQYSGAMNSMQSADVAPTASQRRTIAAAHAAGDPAIASWKSLRTELTALNVKLKAAGMKPITTTE
jgi:hypothetical protein